MLLGRFIETLLRGWRIIVLAVVACVIGAAVYTLTQPTSYSARALVATVHETTRVTLGTDIVALSEDDLAKASASAKERLQSFVVFVNNPEVAEEVVAELGDRLPADLRNAKRLLRMVRGSLAAGSDTIEIVVTTREAQTAAMIANAWARAYVHQINMLYEGFEASKLGVVEQEANAAAEVYTQRQADVEAFLANDRRDELQRVISDTVYLLDALTQVNRTAQYGALISQQQAYEGAIATLSEAQQARLDTLIAEHAGVEALLRDAGDMRAQVSKGGETAAHSNELALMLLKASAYSTRATLVEEGQTLSQPAIALTFQPGASEMTASGMLADLDALVSTLEARRAALAKDIAALAEAQMQGEQVLLLGISADLSPAAAIGVAGGQADDALGALISSNQAKLNTARTDFAQADRRLLELESLRDLAWQSYDALLRRQTEIAISGESIGSRVRLAVPASVPEAAGSNLAVNLGLAGVAGLLVGLVVAWIVGFWRDYRERSAEQRPTAAA